MINLLHGDCLDLMKDIPDNSIDCVLTDPPYGTTACKWDSVIPFEPMWDHLKRIIKPNGAIALFGSEPFSSALRMSNIKMFKYDWTWVKNSFSNHLNAKRQPLRFSEIISVFYIKQPTFNRIPYADREISNWSTVHRKDTQGVNGKHNAYTSTDTRKIKAASNIIYFNTVHKMAKIRTHNSQKPVALLEYLIKTYTLENETVLDFTMGSGSTGVACKNLNRKFIGIEKDDKYFEIAKNRIGNE